MTEFERLRRLLLAGIAATASSACQEAPQVDECDDPVPIVTEDGRRTGYVRCADGLVDRIGPATCDPRPAGEACFDSVDGSTCAEDLDCDLRPHGRCVVVYEGGSLSTCGCSYGCANDDDCDQSAVCACPTGRGSRCIPDTCGSSADCADGRCGVTPVSVGCETEPRLACRTASDACQVDADCGDSDWCTIASGARSCEGGITCGRPLMVDAQPRLAPVGRGSAWAAGSSPTLDGLDRATRRALAAQWAEIGALEHASVASFARFTMEMLALGAPGALIAETQSAGADEVEHARMAFGLASAYAGSPIGPGAFDLTGVVLRTDLDAVVDSLIDEGCIGEVLGAVEAAAAAQRATDPVISAAFARIAEDESRHALLAWRSLRWLSTRGADAERMRHRLDVELTRIAARTAPDGPHDPRCGLWSPAARHRLHLRALATVIRPLIDEMFTGAMSA